LEAPNVTFSFWEAERENLPFAANEAGVALRVPDVVAARAELEAKGVEFLGETWDSAVCHFAAFRDPDGNTLPAPALRTAKRADVARSAPGRLPCAQPGRRDRVHASASSHRESRPEHRLVGWRYHVVKLRRAALRPLPRRAVLKIVRWP
jgi:hypothetical protein